MEISIKNLSFSINHKNIIDNISFQVKDKELVGIIGPNGSGKSTLLKCIYRILNPEQGAIYFDGKNLNDLSLRQSSLYMSVVSQHSDCNFEFTVEELVMMGRTPHKRMLEGNNDLDKDIVKQALKEVGLENMEKRNFLSLSGGERQRVVLARALAQKTPCLIMDEPTNHLDIKYQLQIMKTVKNTGLTTIFAVHDLNTAALYCDRLIAIKDGKLIGEGTPEDLLTPNFIEKIY